MSDGMSNLSRIAIESGSNLSGLFIKTAASPSHKFFGKPCLGGTLGRGFTPPRLIAQRRCRQVHTLKTEIIKPGYAEHLSIYFSLAIKNDYDKMKLQRFKKSLRK
jgi:hypothetical protein